MSPGSPMVSPDIRKSGSGKYSPKPIDDVFPSRPSVKNTKRDEEVNRLMTKAPSFTSSMSDRTIEDTDDDNLWEEKPISDDDEHSGFEEKEERQIRNIIELLNRFEQQNDIDNEMKTTLYTTLLKIIANVYELKLNDDFSVVTYPEVSKYRTLRRDNPKLLSKLTAIAYGRELLSLSGFIEDVPKNIWRFPSGRIQLAKWSLTALEEHLRAKEETEYRKIRDQRIEQEKRNDFVASNHLRRQLKRKDALDKERERVLKMLERDKKEREAEAKFSVPPSLHNASSKTISPKELKPVELFDGEDEDSPYKTRLFIQSPPARSIDDPLIRPRAFKIPVIDSARPSEKGIRTMQAMTSPMDYERPRSKSVTRFTTAPTVSTHRSLVLPMESLPIRTIPTEVHRTTQVLPITTLTRISRYPTESRPFTPLRCSPLLRSSSTSNSNSLYGLQAHPHLSSIITNHQPLITEGFFSRDLTRPDKNPKQQSFTSPSPRYIDTLTFPSLLTHGVTPVTPSPKHGTTYGLMSQYPRNNPTLSQVAQAIPRRATAIASAPSRSQDFHQRISFPQMDIDKSNITTQPSYLTTSPTNEQTSLMQQSTFSIPGDPRVITNTSAVRHPGSTERFNRLPSFSKAAGWEIS